MATGGRLTLDFMVEFKLNGGLEVFYKAICFQDIIDDFTVGKFVRDIKVLFSLQTGKIIFWPAGSRSIRRQ